MQTLTLLAADVEANEITGDAIQVFVNFFLAIGMFVVLFLPLLLIPYIFIKLGSMAGKVQAKMNNLGKAPGKAAWGTAKSAAKQGAKGAAKRGWENKSAQWASRESGLRKQVGGYKAQRDYKRSENKKAAEKLQEEAIHKRVGMDKGFARSAAGVGGTAGVKRLEYGAEAAVERREQEERKMAADSMRREGIESDRAALVAKAHAATTAAEVHAAADLLLKTGGTEEYKGLLLDQSLMAKNGGEIGKTVIAAGRANYGTVDAKSRDVADFMAQADAARIAANGGADQAIRVETRDGSMKLGSRKLIGLEPKALGRMKEEALKMTQEMADPTMDAAVKAAMLQRLQTLVNQANQSLSDTDFGAAKTETQQHLKDIAKGKFN